MLSDIDIEVTKRLQTKGFLDKPIVNLVDALEYLAAKAEIESKVMRETLAEIKFGHKPFRFNDNQETRIEGNKCH